MKAKHVLYFVIIVGLLASTGALPVLAEEGDIEMWVHRTRVTYTGRSSGGPDAIVAYIHIRDTNLEMVEGALVTALWTLPDGSTYEQKLLTNAQGIAPLSVWEGAGDYTICVTDVTKAGWEYNPELNWETCGSFVLPPYKPGD
jgi:hypothetical protein